MSKSLTVRATCASIAAAAVAAGLTCCRPAQKSQHQPAAASSAASLASSGGAHLTSEHDGGPSKDAPALDDKAAIAEGKASYERYCKLCHGENAVGYAADHAPQLRNPAFLASATGKLLEAAIEYGRPGTPMAGFSDKMGGPLSEDKVDHLIKYLRSLSTVDVRSDVVVGDPARGKVVFEQHCVSCHGEHGEGKTAPSLSNPYFLITATDGYLRYAISYGRPKTPMRAFSESLTPTEIDDVTRYIRTWSRNVTYGSAVGEPLPKLEDLILNPRAATPDLSIVQGRYVSADAVEQAMKDHKRLVLLDARPQSDWIASHIPGSYPAPFYDDVDPAVAKALPRDGTWIILYCSCPHAASDHVMDKLRAAGFAKTAVIQEGFLEWTRRKYPVTFGKTSAK